MPRMSLPYLALKKYIRFFTETLYYEKTYVQGIENIPSSDKPVLVTSNHQNSMNDAMAILLAIRDRKTNFIVRADVFALHPLVNKFLRSIGLLPAFRLGHEGAEAMKKNEEMFAMSEKALIDGETVAIFPEGGHAEGHWFNVFKGGMAKMAFEAAKMANFEKEIFVIPTCNHYSSYHGLKGKMIIRFGEPVPVSQFYELYKTKPRTATRELSDLIHSKVEEMVLNEKDHEYYYEMEYLRNGNAGKEFAEASGIDPENFELRFESDKAFIAKFLEARMAENPYFKVVKTDEGMSVEETAQKQIEEQNEAKANAGVKDVAPGAAEKLLLKVRDFLSLMKKEKVLDRQLDSHPSGVLTFLKTLVLIAFLPLAIFCIWPSIVCWCLPKRLADKAKGDMFEGTFLIAINVLIISPIVGILTFLLVGFKVSFILAAVYVLLFPVICMFEWYYCQEVKNTLADWRWFSAKRRGATKKLEDMRNSILEQVKGIVNR